MRTFHADTLVDGPFQLGENPLWDDRRQCLFWTDIDAGELWCCDADGGALRRLYDDAPVGGFTLQHDGSLLLFRVDDIARLALDDDGEAGELTEVLPFADPGVRRFNDVIACPDGSVVAGTIGVADTTASVYQLRAHEPGATPTLTRLWNGAGICNGMGFTPDLSRFYWTDSTPRTIEVMPVRHNGQTQLLEDERRLFSSFVNGDGVPDGLDVDTAGRVWSARWDGAAVLCHEPETAAILARVEIPTPKATSCVFGGPDLDRLYVTSSQGGVYVARSIELEGDVRGRKTFRSSV